MYFTTLSAFGLAGLLFLLIPELQKAIGFLSSRAFIFFPGIWSTKAFHSGAVTAGSFLQNIPGSIDKHSIIVPLSSRSVTPNFCNVHTGFIKNYSHAGTGLALRFAFTRAKAMPGRLFMFNRAPMFTPGKHRPAVLVLLALVG